MTNPFNDRHLRALVLYYGLYQAGHFVLNVFYFLGAVNFPPEPAAGNWGAVAMQFFNAMAAVDTLLAGVSMAAVYAFLCHSTWSIWGLMLAITATLPSAIIYTFVCAFHQAGIVSLVAINLMYLPTLGLWIWLCLLEHRWIRARLT